MAHVLDVAAPVVEALVTVVVVAIGLAAWTFGLLDLGERPWRRARRHDGQGRPVTGRVRRSATDAAIETRVQQMAVMGLLPPGWSRRDVERLLRIRARRMRLTE